MKKYFVIAGFIPFLFACNQKKVDELQNQVNTLSAQNADYQRGKEDMEKQISDYLDTYSEVQATLDDINKQQGVVEANLNKETSGRPDKARMVASIKSLNDMIEKNKAAVAELEKKYKNANFKVKDLDKLVASLNDQIQEKETELVALKSDLDKANVQVADLSTQLNTVSTEKETLQAQNTDQANTIAQQTESLHTAYYVVGTYKELRDKGVLTKEGGFIGIGKSKDLAPDFNTGAFTRIDITSFSELPLHTKDAKIVTAHSTSSYKLVEGDKEIEELVINNPDEFWRSSKYLVVLTD